MPGHSRSKNGVASLAYVPGIHVFVKTLQDMDGRDEPGHDGKRSKSGYFAAACISATYSQLTRFSTNALR
jgi:hypothetical protein